MRRLWWLLGLAAVCILAAAGWWGHRPLLAARAWVGARLTNPLQHVGALRGAAIIGDLPGTRPETLWADRPDQAPEVRALQSALRSAAPVLGVLPGPCGPLEGETMALLPVHGAEIDVTPFWSCRTVGHRVTGVDSPALVVAMRGGRRLGVFRAPGLAAAFTQDHWGEPAEPPLSVSPTVCPPGCMLTIVGHGFIDATARLQVATDLGWVTLATVPTHDGDFTWKGTPPAGLPPGHMMFNATVVPQVRITLLPRGMAGLDVTAAPAPTVVSAGMAQIRYPALASSAAAPGAQGTAASVQAQDVYATNGGQVLRSAEGGLGWTVLHGFTDAHVLALSFADAAHGWGAVQPVLGRPFPLCPPPPPVTNSGPYGSSCLVRTADGGRTWTSVAGAPPAPEWVHCFSASSGVVVSRSGAVYRTADGGATWTAWGVVPWGEGPQGPVQVDFGSPDFGVAQLVGGDHMGPELAITTDGGRQWATQPVAAREVTSVSAPAARVIWMVTQTCAGTHCAGTLQRTTDSGRTWSAVNLGEALSADLPDRPFLVVGQSATAAWLVVPGHRALHTDDGGKTWTQG